MGQGKRRRQADATADAAAVLERALALHRAGQPEQAARLCRRVLDDDPGNADALHLLGVAALQQGRARDAVTLIGKAAKRRNKNPRILNNLGEAYRALGRHDKAADCYRRAIALDAGDPAPHNNLGNVLASQGEAEQAAACYRRALAIRPDDPEILANLGDALRQSGKPGEAASQFERAVAAAPAFIDAHVNLGRALTDLNRLTDAEAACRRAVRLAPDHAGALGALGNVLAARDELPEAVACYRRAVAIAPDDPAALTNLGNGLQKQGDDDAAIAAFERALHLDPDFVEALGHLGDTHQRLGHLDIAADLFRRVLAIAPDHGEALNDLGLCLVEMGKVDDALESYRRAIARRSDDAEAHTNYGMALMRAGRFAKAWPEYEWRWLTKGNKAKPMHPQPEWQGQDVAGKTILAWGEQGVGDEVLYAGMVPDLMARGANVVLECERRLAPLFERSFAGVRCIALRDPPAAECHGSDIDYQTPTGSLGRWLRPNLAAFPPRRSYLRPDPARRDALKAEYGRHGKLVVGIAWYSKNSRIGHHKSMTLRDLAPLAAVPGVTLVDLQYGDTAAERQAFERATGAALVHDATVDQMTSLDDFAAQVAAMDLVVSVSNTTVHIAGALGVPTWVMLHTLPLPCWLLGRDDSPWYPAAKLFRQGRRGEWAEVVERVRVELREFSQRG